MTSIDYIKFNTFETPSFVYILRDHCKKLSDEQNGYLRVVLLLLWLLLLFRLLLLVLLRLAELELLLG